MNLAAPPQCCGNATKYVFVSHRCQFWFCDTCKQEAYAVAAYKEPVAPITTVGDIQLEINPDYGWVIV